MTDQQKVEAYIDQQQQETFDLLARMVRQPSVQYHEAGAQQVVIDKLKQLELDVDVWDPDIEALKKIRISSLPEKILPTVPMLWGYSRVRAADGP